MTIGFWICAFLTLGSAVAAMALRNLVHCALSLVLTFVGLAAIYLQLGAQFIGFAQVLVYIGAVAILIVFAILLTRGITPQTEPLFSRGSISGIAIAITVFAVLAAVIGSSKALKPHSEPAQSVTVRQLGEELMGKYVLPLEVAGLVLTAALIGAVLIAMNEKRTD